MADRFTTQPVSIVPPLGEQHRQRGRRQGQGFGAYAAVDEPASAPAPEDSASVLGIPEHMLTEEVRAAVASLMAALDQSRAELVHFQHRLDLFDEAAHRHDMLPLLDRRGMTREITKLVTHIAQGGLGGSFVLMHVGGIERLRLMEGIAAADAALLHVADVLAEGVRESDATAALGGSDFGMLLVLADPPAAASKARELAERINRPAYRWRGGQIVLPVTYGVTHVQAESTLAELIAEADVLRR